MSLSYTSRRWLLPEFWEACLCMQHGTAGISLQEAGGGTARNGEWPPAAVEERNGDRWRRWYRERNRSEKMLRAPLQEVNLLIFSLQKILYFDESSGFHQLKELAHHFWGWSQCLCKCPKVHLHILKHSLTSAMWGMQWRKGHRRCLLWPLTEQWGDIWAAPTA